MSSCMVYHSTDGDNSKSGVFWLESIITFSVNAPFVTIRYHGQSPTRSLHLGRSQDFRPTGLYFLHCGKWYPSFSRASAIVAALTVIHQVPLLNIWFFSNLIGLVSRNNNDTCRIVNNDMAKIDKGSHSNTRLSDSSDSWPLQIY